MRKVNSKKTAFLVILLCAILAAVSVVGLAGCKNNDNTGKDNTAATQAPAEVSFKFIVVGKDGTEKTFDLKSSKEMLAQALLDENLVSGTEGDWGLMVDTVDGEKLDYNADGYYWALYIDGEYAQTGVSSTPIKEGSVYKFAAEKSE